MRIVENDFERMLIINIHSSRRLEEGRAERSQTLANIFQADIHVVSKRCREHGVLHIVQSPVPRSLPGSGASTPAEYAIHCHRS